MEPTKPAFPTILIVDDNVSLAECLAEWLGAPDRKVVIAFDGYAGLALALEHLPHVVILDIGLPGKNGHELTVELRRHPIIRTALIIAVSGYGLPESARAFKAGVDHFFVKPADPHKLAALVTQRFESLH